ncbi:hypothetical protein F4680DRAFT_434538 [Xylaria scruposa]|nr:hypothetical protein F4680DRAFT_434538 [Xylaria scruposa]
MTNNPPITHYTAKAGEAKASGPASPRNHRTTVTTTGLSVVYEPERLEPVLDIIFIHGLQGHPFKTWAVEVGRDHGEKLSSEHRAKACNDPKARNEWRNLLSRLRKFKLTHDSKTPEGQSYVFWPADLLPTEVPRARILVFGYNTVIAKHQFAGAVNKNSVFAHSKDLVNELFRARPLERPVLFVTHSLGGIVAKESLAICSTSNDENFEDILKSTTGVMFLGTPHRGSNAAGVGEIARKAASLLLMDTNSRVLDSLSLKNSDLERCQDTFSSLWLKYNFRVKTFQEGLPLQLPIRLGQSKMVKVVPDISSCLGDSRERAETLDGDHRSMCRYTDTQDQNYKKVAAELRAVYTKLISKSLAMRVDQRLPRSNITHDEEGKLEHFKFAEALFRQLSIHGPAENTCQWLPQTPSFTAWTERVDIDSHLGLLQIIGKPGSGKSTLMKQALEITRVRFQGNSGICILSHFFDRSGQLLQHSSTGILRSLLYQLGIQYPDSLMAFRDYTQADLNRLESSDPKPYTNILKSRLEKIFSDPSLAPQRTIIFVDALDECDSGDAADMGYFLAQLAGKAHHNQIQLDVCISRRQYPSITVKNSLEVHMEMFNGVDIQHYIQQRFEITNIPTTDQDILIRAVFQKSNGIFLWVVLAIEGILKDIEIGKNIKYILKRTESLPKTLETFYERIIGDMDLENRRMALRLFQWAVLATERLRIREWHHILAFLRDKAPASLKEWKTSDYYTETDDQLERRIRNLSQGLVEVKVPVDVSIAASDSGSLMAGAGSLDSNLGDSRIVQPIHETVTEFFTSGCANWLYMENSGCDFRGGGHLFIASTCLAYINIAELDGLVHARQRFEASSPSDHPQNKITRGRAKNEDTVQNKAHRRRSSSVTSFMSSASSHSGKYHGNELPRTGSRYEEATLNFGEDLLPPAYSPVITLQPPKARTFRGHGGVFRSFDAFIIRHDDSTPDGNMNLVVDTVSGRKQPDRHYRLYYLRMHNLSRREFSLERYYYPGSNEVCQSRQKDADVIRLELRDHKTTEIKYVTSQEAQTYRFSYWRLKYEWKRVVNNSLVSFYLFQNPKREDSERGDTVREDSEREDSERKDWAGERDPVASLVPVVRQPEEVTTDELRGVWVPPYHMRLTDNLNFKDKGNIEYSFPSPRETIKYD